MPAGESVSSALNPAPGPDENSICAVSAVIDGETESIILHRREGRLLAWLNICPHEGRRLDFAPGQFLRDGDLLICAAHGACFSLESGECVSGPCRGQSLRAVRLLPDLSSGTSG